MVAFAPHALKKLARQVSPEDADGIAHLLDQLHAAAGELIRLLRRHDEGTLRHIARRQARWYSTSDKDAASRPRVDRIPIEERGPLEWMASFHVRIVVRATEFALRHPEFLAESLSGPRSSDWGHGLSAEVLGKDVIEHVDYALEAFTALLEVIERGGDELHLDGMLTIETLAYNSLVRQGAVMIGLAALDRLAQDQPPDFQDCARYIAKEMARVARQHFKDVHSRLRPDHKPIAVATLRRRGEGPPDDVDVAKLSKELFGRFRPPPRKPRPQR